MILLYAGLYALFLIYLTLGFFCLPKPKYSEDEQRISVIISARNEEKHLPELLNRLLQQNYGNYEIVIADDRSSDKTLSILQNYAEQNKQLRYVVIEQKTTNPGKKNALNEAIKLASGEILAFTDADCLPSANWLKEINAHFLPHTDFLVGYSPLLNKKKLLGSLKNLERAAIFALTAGSFGHKLALTCAARNMAYRKNLFLKVNGFAGIIHLPSGDDDLMLQKMAPYIRSYNFMFTSDSSVASYDKDNFAEHLHLETRRASKFRYHSVFVKSVSLFVFIFYICLSLYFLNALFSGQWLNVLLAFALKIFAELVFVSVFLLKIKRIGLLKVMFFVELLYIPYFIFFGLRGTFFKYQWKR